MAGGGEREGWGGEVAARAGEGVGGEGEGGEEEEEEGAG